MTTINFYERASSIHSLTRSCFFILFSFLFETNHTCSFHYRTLCFCFFLISRLSSPSTLHYDWQTLARARLSLKLQHQIANNRCDIAFQFAVHHFYNQQPNENHENACVNNMIRCKLFCANFFCLVFLLLFVVVDVFLFLQFYNWKKKKKKKMNSENNIIKRNETVRTIQKAQTFEAICSAIKDFDVW